MNDQAKFEAALYLVATPIGNLEDLSPRALRILKSVALILAEDTRHTQKLLHAFQIDVPLESFHQHSSPDKAKRLIEKIVDGQALAFVSDAGTPGISDPGAELAQLAHEHGLPVIPIPGPSALAALLSASGFEASSFSFLGFFPREEKERSSLWKELQRRGGLQVCYESPHRILACLRFLAEQAPEMPLVIGRELTKKFECITRGSAQFCLERLEKEEPRGEYVLAWELPSPEASQEQVKMADAELNALFEELLALGANQKLLTRVGISHGFPKNRSYSMALDALKKQ